MRSRTGRWDLIHDESAALAPLFLFILLFFLWAAVSVLNVGQDTRDKIEAQNAIDAVSLAVADQSARDLNVLAMNQVAASQSFTIALSSAALQQALIQTAGRVALVTPEAVANCISKDEISLAFCGAVGGVITTVFGIWLGKIELEYLPHRGFTTGNRVTEALGRMSEHIVETHPQRVSAIAKTIAEADGLEALFVYPVCDTSNGSDCDADRDFPGESLPVEPASSSFLFGLFSPATTEMCQAIESGSDGFVRLDYRQHGYPDQSGPLTAGGSSDNPKLRDHINETSGLSSLLPSFYQAMKWAELVTKFDLAKHSYEQKSDSNEFLDTFDATWALNCPRAGSLETYNDAKSRSRLASLAAAAPLVYVTRPTNYWLKGRYSASSLISSLSFMGPAAIAAGSDFEPFSPVYFGARPQSVRSNGNAFDFDNDPFYAYAQSMVFNEASHDLYTGRWTADLVPAFRMNDPIDIGQALGTEQASDSFDKLRRLLNASGSGGEWQDVNTR